MKDVRAKPNQLIVISKEASVWSLRLRVGRSGRRSPSFASFPAIALPQRRLRRHSGGRSSGTTNMPAVYSI